MDGAVLARLDSKCYVDADYVLHVLHELISC